MRRIALALLLLPLAACGNGGGDHDDPGVPGTGSGEVRGYAVAGFTGVELAGADDVDVRVGPAFSVRAEGPAKQLDLLRIARDGDTLRIGRRRSAGLGWSHGEGVRIHVTMPRIVQATLAGSGDFAIDRVSGQGFAATLAGSGDLRLGTLAVDSLGLSIAGSGDVSAAGTARSLKVEIAGSGDVAASGLKAASADISIAGSGGVRATVAGPANVTVMGSGDVDLGPAARCRTTRMGSGTIRCG